MKKILISIYVFSTVFSYAVVKCTLNDIKCHISQKENSACSGENDNDSSSQAQKDAADKCLTSVDTTKYEASETTVKKIYESPIGDNLGTHKSVAKEFLGSLITYYPTVASVGVSTVNENMNDQESSNNVSDVYQYNINISFHKGKLVGNFDSNINGENYDLHLVSMPVYNTGSLLYLGFDIGDDHYSSIIRQIDTVNNGKLICTHVPNIDNRLHNDLNVHVDGSYLTQDAKIRLFNCADIDLVTKEKDMYNRESIALSVFISNRWSDELVGMTGDAINSFSVDMDEFNSSNRNISICKNNKNIVTGVQQDFSGSTNCNAGD